MTFPSSKSWAPLRLDHRRRGGDCASAFPSSKSWAPLRQVAGVFDISEWVLFPAPKAGLHCDRTATSGSHHYFCSFSQLQKLGSSATSLQVSSWSFWGCSFPSSKSWAPLRPRPARESARRMSYFSQLQKLGSIATVLLCVPGGLSPSAFPSSKSWAPLRLAFMASAGSAAPAFSQLQKLGSIATPRSCRTSAKVKPFSQLQKLGSIAT